MAIDTTNRIIQLPSRVAQGGQGAVVDGQARSVDANRGDRPRGQQESQAAGTTQVIDQSPVKNARSAQSFQQFASANPHAPRGSLIDIIV